MTVKKLVEAIDAQVVAGDIIGAFEQFAADNCITHSNPQDATHSKGQKTEALRWFFSNIERIDNIARTGVSIVSDTETQSQFVFNFTNKQNQPLVYNEVIRRVWNDGKMVEEQYLFDAVLPAEKPAKKAKADAVAAPAAAKVTEKKAAAPAAKKATEKKDAAPKASAEKKAEPKAAKKTAAAKPERVDDLTIIEGIGPKIAELLQNAGIVYFADLAKAKPAAIKTILEAAGKRYQMHDPATWPKQAALARDGKAEELAKLQDQLKGGK